MTLATTADWVRARDTAFVEAASIVRALIPPNPDGDKVETVIGEALEMAAREIEGRISRGRR